VAGGAAPSDETASRAALGAGVLCYLIWGFAPLFFQAMGRLGADSWEILAHRAVWGTLAAWVFVVLARQGNQVAAVLRSPRRLGMLALSALLIGANWALYVWGVNAGRVLESSLGYYLTPLLNMAAGVLIFRERFDVLGLGAIVLAGIGVALQGLALGHAVGVGLCAILIKVVAQVDHGVEPNTIAARRHADAANGQSGMDEDRRAAGGRGQGRPVGSRLDRRLDHRRLAEWRTGGDLGETLSHPPHPEPRHRGG
jgi:drug/metabolite transporter (DMT)-like permease